MSAKPGSGPAQMFLRDHASHAGTECLIWPFALNKQGYPRIKWNGHSNVAAHTLMCELAHGRRPAERPEVAHSCGNPACINPNHLRWASRVENEMDKLRHGTETWGEKHPQAIFTVEQVRSIYRDARSANAIAREYKCSTNAILRIKKGRTWAHVTGHRCAEGTISFHLQQAA